MLLSQPEILRLHAAAISADLAGSRRPLLAGIDPTVVAEIPNAESAAAQILNDLDALNSTAAPADGTPPLLTWLENAVALVGPRQQAAIFEEALKSCRHPRPAPSTPVPLERSSQASKRPSNSFVLSIVFLIVIVLVAIFLSNRR